MRDKRPGVADDVDNDLRGSESYARQVDEGEPDDEYTSDNDNTGGFNWFLSNDREIK